GVTVLTAGRLTAAAPAGSVGAAQVRVTNPDAQFGNFSSFTYTPSNGDLDPGFGTGGVVTSNPSTFSDAPQGVLSDGTYLYVFGVDRVQGNTDAQWRIEKRAMSNGALETTTFGTGGVVTSN